ncbi:MAG: acyltransferase family protein [Proteobacteria bacterium]|nr:acyltransferase family protein [Pseudomonadota bacterium]
METRKYFLDWLRVLAFAALILFHVGMLYVSWRYPLKSPRLYPGIEPWMNALSAWRLALLFLISGVASRFLIDKLGPGAFARDRLRRLLPVSLIGMFVVIPPQTYVVLVSRSGLRMDFPTFCWTQYLRADQTLVRPLGISNPTWAHLWFLVYLLDYALAAAGVIWAARRLGIRRSLAVPPWLLIFGPPIWLVAANLLILTKAPITQALVNDWGGHMKWLGLFITGLLAARQDRFWTLVEAHRGKALATAAVLLAIQSRVNDPLWSAVSGLYAWAAICALCGFAKAKLNRPSPWLSHLNEAVLPIYVLHQPILLISAFFLFPLRLATPVEALLLAAATGLGSFAIYEMLIRPFAVSRFLFGLKQKTVPASRTVKEVSPIGQK